MSLTSRVILLIKPCHLKTESTKYLTFAGSDNYFWSLTTVSMADFYPNSLFKPCFVALLILLLVF